ncbi:MAG: kelch repeat-containing protein [Candidatus Bathyarchaeum tardum]|nr:MAG: kelch repeat-containing protein [Candidatus Bathyarchaeum tardum]
MKRSASLLALLLFLSVVLPAFSTPLVWAAEDSWTTLEPMPTERAWLGVAVVDGKIYAIVDTINYEYDPSTNSWTTKTPMPTPRNGFGIAVVENKIYVIGGGTVINEAYDPTTDTWETKAPMNIARSGLSASVINGKIYCIGGNRGEPTYSGVSATEVYDPSTDTWTTAHQIPTPVTGHVSAVVNNKIYIIGGAIGVTLNQIYDLETDAWSTGAPLPTGVDSAAAGVTAGTTGTQRIFVIGGKQNLDAVKLNQVYDPETDTWVYGPAMPTARYSLGVAVVNDSIYAIGGREGWFGSPVSAANEKYTPADFIPEFPSLSILVAGVSVVLILSVFFRQKIKKGRKT